MWHQDMRTLTFKMAPLSDFVVTKRDLVAERKAAKFWEEQRDQEALMRERYLQGDPAADEYFHKPMGVSSSEYQVWKAQQKISVKVDPLSEILSSRSAINIPAYPVHDLRIFEFVSEEQLRYSEEQLRYSEEQLRYYKDLLKRSMGANRTKLKSHLHGDFGTGHLNVHTHGKLVNVTVKIEKKTTGP